MNKSKNLTLEEIKSAVIDGDWRNIGNFTQEALKEGIDVQEIIDMSLTGGMDVVSERFSDGTFFIPNLLLVSRAMKTAMEVIKPNFKIGGVKQKGKVVIGTI